MEVPTLTSSASRDPPADAIFAYPGCPLPLSFDLLAQVPDPRKRRGRRHALAGLLAVGIAAVIAGSRSFAAMGSGPPMPDRRAGRAGRGARAGGGVHVRRAFALVSADVLDRALGAWLWTRAVQAGGWRVIAIDGKTVRGARNKTGKAPHLVAALAHGIGAVLGQVAVEEKSNEIPAVRELLKAFTDLTGAVVTIDAMHTQHDTAQAILSRDAEYVMTVKANMPTLYRQLKKLPWTSIPAVSTVSTGPRPPRPPHHQGPGRRWPGSGSPEPPRSRSSDARSPGTARRPSRSSTSLPATATPIRPPWPPGPAATGR